MLPLTLITKEINDLARQIAAIHGRARKQDANTYPEVLAHGPTPLP